MDRQTRASKGTWRGKHFFMLLVFIGADLVMGYCLGVRFLNGMEFTGLQLFPPDPAHGFAGNEHVFFHWWDYALYCTLPCVLEDLVITLILWSADRQTREWRGMTETSSFWIMHVCIKILLNLHATAMFLGVLTYSRESLWETMSPLAPQFGMSHLAAQSTMPYRHQLPGLQPEQAIS